VQLLRRLSLQRPETIRSGSEEHYTKSGYAYWTTKRFAWGCGACEEHVISKNPSGSKTERRSQRDNAMVWKLRHPLSDRRAEMKLIRPASHIPDWLDKFKDLPLDENGNPIPPKLRF
jgi:hypothetical protein